MPEAKIGWKHNAYHASILGVSFAFCVYWFFCLPKSSKALLVLGGVAALMLLADLHPRLKAAYVIVIISLIFIENRALDKERAAFSREEGSKRKEENEKFQTIARGINQTISQNQEQFDATMARMRTFLREEQKAVAISEKNLEYATGGDEFCYLITVPPNALAPAPPGRWPLYLSNSGNVPLPICNMQIIEYPGSKDTPEEVERKFRGVTQLRFGPVPPKDQNSQPTPYSVIPAPLYNIIIHTSTQAFIEDLTFTANPSIFGGYSARWKVYRGNVTVLDSQN